MSDPRRFAPATERNRDPILAVLRRVVPADARVLEIASGSGEHAAYFSRELPVASWQPTDFDDGARAGIDAWATHAGATKMLPAKALDVEAKPWPFPPASIDVVFCANMSHIAPWSACLGLLDGARAVLAAGGLLVLYGPYRVGGAHTAPSNEAFDASLRSRDARWGVRDLETVIAEAEKRGFTHRETVGMPANNLMVVFGNGVDARLGAPD